MNAAKSGTVTDSEAPRKQKTRIKGVPDPGVSLRLSPIGQLDLTSRKLAVIGGTNGLGRAIARQALARGAEVTVVGRTFRDDPAPRLTFVAADLSSMREAARVGRELPAESFDVVLFTTGIIAAKTREETPEHIERDMAVSYLSRLAILQGLSSRLGTAREPGALRPRVFIMGSPGVGTLGDPGDLNSETYKLFETAVGLFTQSAETYAKRTVPLLFTPELEGRTGLMFGHKAHPIRPTEGVDRAQRHSLGPPPVGDHQDTVSLGSRITVVAARDFTERVHR